MSWYPGYDMGTFKKMWLQSNDTKSFMQRQKKCFYECPVCYHEECTQKSQCWKCQQYKNQLIIATSVGDIHNQMRKREPGSVFDPDAKKWESYYNPK